VANEDGPEPPRVGTPPGGDYAVAPPNPQQTLDLFAGEWASRLPGELGALRAGAVPAFEDPRIEWALAQLGGVAGQRVLELGPLEGGHAYMLERAGASEVVSIEAHPRAYLRCLVAKELVGLQRVHFLFGDFIQLLRADQSRYDLVVASGVLYHMRNPIELLSSVARVSDRLFVWTHYYDEARIAREPTLARRFTGAITAYADSFRHTLHRFDYADVLATPAYCGGGAGFCYWLERSDLLGALRHFGFTRVEVGFDDVDHPHGPSLALVATRG
jgi:hypothetical protein